MNTSVYMVLEDLAYEGFLIRGVYTTKEAAEWRRAELTATERRYRDQYYIEEHILNVDSAG